MVDPVSIFTIIGAIAALVSAFRDGKDMFQKWLKKRKGNVPKDGSRLRTYLEGGPAAAQREYDNGYARFGPRFAQGDEISCTSMDEIVRELYNRLIQVLGAALEKPATVTLNFDALCEAATRANLNSSYTFTQLAQRMHSGGRIPRMFHRLNFQSRKNTRPTGQPPFSSSDYLPVSTWAPEPLQAHAGVNIVSSGDGFYPTAETTVSLAVQVSPVLNGVSYVAPDVQDVRGSPIFRSISNSSNMSQATFQTLSTNASLSSISSFSSRPLLSDHILDRNLRALQTSAIPKSVRLTSTSSITLSTRPVNKLEQLGASTSAQSTRSHASLASAKAPSIKSAPSSRSRIGFCGPDHETSQMCLSDTGLDNRDFQGASGGRPTRMTETSHHPLIQDWVQKTTPYFHPQGYFAEQAAHKPPLGDSNATEPSGGHFSSPSLIASPHHSPQSRELSRPAQTSGSVDEYLAQCQQALNFCSVSRSLQVNKTGGDWQSYFEFPIGSTDIRCKHCNSDVPGQKLDVNNATSGWEVAVRFLAKCHIADIEKVNAPLACVLCKSSGAFRGRNELWAHLETHSDSELQTDGDIRKLP